MSLSFKSWRLPIAALALAVGGLLPGAVQAGWCPDSQSDAVGDTAAVRSGDSQSDEPYVDIVEAWVRPAADYPAMELGLRTSQPIPFFPKTNTNVLFFFDINEDLTDNDPAGTRAGADAAFSLTFSPDRGNWMTSRWRYDPANQTWVSQPDPNVLWAFDGGGPIIHVPFDIFPRQATWPWRAALAVGAEGESSGDSYPDGQGEMVVCLPDEPPLVITRVDQESGQADGQENGGQPTAATSGQSLPWWVYLWAIVLVAGGLSMGIRTLRGIRERVKGGGLTTTEPPALGGGEEPDPGDPGSWSQPDEPPPDAPEEPPETPATNPPQTPPLAPTPPEPPTATPPAPPETPPAEPPSVPPPPPERDGCNCPRCRLFIAIGGQRNAAVASAANLGQAIRRDTDAATNLSPEDRCLKVAHFYDARLQSGRYVRRQPDGQLVWENFRHRSVATADGYGDPCLWKEVMLVHHGESQGHVRSILANLQQLIPSQPIQRLVLYYCGGEGTLPRTEFEALASQLGRRLRQIPERCRPDHVDIYLAPTIDLGGDEHFTRLVIEQNGLISYDGLMMHYTVDQDGNITRRGNERPPGGQLFGSVPLGRLGEDDRLDAEAYRSHWNEIARMNLSDIKRYRARIREAGLEEPPLTRPEQQEQGFRDLMNDDQEAAMSESDWDELTRIRSRSEAGRWLRQKFGGDLR